MTLSYVSLIVALVCAIISVLPVPKGNVPWFGISWLCFVLSVVLIGVALPIR